MTVRKLAAALLVLAVLMAAPPAEAKDPGAHPLGPARVALLAGSAARGTDGRPVRAGDSIPPGERLRVAAAADGHLELRFADETLLRLGPAADVTVVAGERRVLLRRGRLLVQADRMIGGVAVWTPRAALEPLGTTYVVEVTGGAAASVLVLEGALQLIRPPRPPERVLLPGEAAQVPAAGPTAPMVVRDILSALDEEPLIRGFPEPLATLARMRDLGDQQRRGVLAGRNERLRRELSWRRPPLRPIVLPDLFQ